MGTTLKIRAAICVALLLSCTLAHASQEGVLPLADITLTSKGIGRSGPIAIAAKRGKGCAFASFHIKAFGKEYKLSKVELQKTQTCHNGIMLTYERGWPSIGGKTLYITMLFGFTSGVRQDLRLTFTANGKLAIKKVKVAKKKRRR